MREISPNTARPGPFHKQPPRKRPRPHLPQLGDLRRNPLSNPASDDPYLDLSG